MRKQQQKKKKSSLFFSLVTECHILFPSTYNALSSPSTKQEILYRKKNKSNDAMGRIHIHAQNAFLSSHSAVFPLDLTWYTTDIILLGPEAQLYHHLRESRSSISLTCLPFRNIFCMSCIVTIQIHFAVNNHAVASFIPKWFWAGTERRRDVLQHC